MEILMRFFGLHWAVAIPLAAIAASTLGTGGLYGIRALESYNPFCISCHLQDHQDYLDDGARAKKAIRTLGGWHLASGKAGCISCHGEEGIVGMARTTFLATKDLVKFAIGDYKQPSRVFHPIVDKDCVKCHGVERLLKLSGEDFHAILDHATLPSACVQCHTGHRAGGRKAKRFIVPKTAQPRCDACHNKLEQKVRVGMNSSLEKSLRLAGLLRASELPASGFPASELSERELGPSSTNP
jgi:hypothetical protein